MKLLLNIKFKLFKNWTLIFLLLLLSLAMGLILEMETTGFATQTAVPVSKSYKFHKKDWKIVEKSDSFFALLNKKIQIPLKAFLDKPQILFWGPSKENKEVGLLIYRAGIIGTSSLYHVDYGVVLDLKNNKILGEAPQRYSPIGHALPLQQPQWTWQKDKIEVNDKSFGKDFTINLIY